jgi:hypothetical protein
MPYATQRDRTPDELELARTPWPMPPLNLFLTTGYQQGTFDLVWDDPAQLSLNSRFIVCGVNVYRSFDSEFGPFHRISHVPIGSRFWRDQTDNELVVEEDVTDQFVLSGSSGVGASAPRYVFSTRNKPIVTEGSQAVPANSPWDVEVRIDGVRAAILQVRGSAGEVEIDAQNYPNVVTQKRDPAVVPTANSKVTCTYRYNRSLLRTDLVQRVFYRAVTVGLPIECDLSTVQPQDLVETPLEKAVATSSYEIEKLDYIWREAVRRNRWILEQGGERVKVFLRKNVGLPCPCVQDDYHKQAQGDCRVCYGVGIVGGYEGPYQILIAPDDAEKKITQKDIGRMVEHTYEVWTGPSPILAQRDFLVKLNGERYSVGAVRMPTNRGMVLQQHFNIGGFDDKDIRARVPMDNPAKYSAVQFVPSGPEKSAEAEPTHKPEIPDERQKAGRSPVWGNITF